MYNGCTWDLNRKRIQNLYVARETLQFHSPLAPSEEASSAAPSCLFQFVCLLCALLLQLWTVRSQQLHKRRWVGKSERHIFPSWVHHICLSACLFCVWGRGICLGTYVEVRWKPVNVGSLPLQHGFQGSYQGVRLGSFWPLSHSIHPQQSREHCGECWDSWSVKTLVILTSYITF